MLSPIRSSKKSILSILIVLILLSFVLAPAGKIASAQVVREDGVLGITLGSLPPGRQVCLGSSVAISVFVRNVSPGLEVPLPVSEAGVTIRDDQGLVRSAQTNAAGYVRITWPVNKEGTIKLTVEAQRQYYLPAQPEKLTLNAVACQYGLKIYFHEEYSVMQDFTLVVGATTTWSGTLKSSRGQGEDPDNEITLAGGSGSYHLYAADTIQAPFHFSLVPDVSGDYTIDVRGRSDGQTVNLEFRTTPIALPQNVSLKVTDYSNRGIEFKVMPPAPVSDGNGLFLELNKLSSVTFPASGGVINLDTGMSCYFYTPDRTRYSLTLMLFPLKDMGASLPAGDSIAFSGRLP